MAHERSGYAKSQTSSVASTAAQIANTAQPTQPANSVFQKA